MGVRKMNKTMFSYVPHGINPNVFFPIDKLDVDYQTFKRKIMPKNLQFDFIIFFNSRNI